MELVQLLLQKEQETKKAQETIEQNGKITIDIKQLVELLKQDIDNRLGRY
ncbi:hypothetical protein [Cytobacillus praedii]|nr:hypothetical protein [Cytobacillus praedii]